MGFKLGRQPFFCEMNRFRLDVMLYGWRTTNLGNKYCQWIDSQKTSCATQMRLGMGGYPRSLRPPGFSPLRSTLRYFFHHVLSQALFAHGNIYIFQSRGILVPSGAHTHTRKWFCAEKDRPLKLYLRVTLARILQTPNLMEFRYLRNECGRKQHIHTIVLTHSGNCYVQCCKLTVVACDCYKW